MRGAAATMRAELIGLGGVVERNMYLIKRYGWWEVAFFLWTVANTLTVVFIAKPIPGKLLGKPVTWLETTTNGVVERETLLKLSDVSLHLFMAASNTADAEALTKTASTLRELEAPAAK